MSQFEHAVIPVVGCDCPAAHKVQYMDLSPLAYFPAEHPVHAVVPVRLLVLEPGLQEAHSVAPDRFWNWPASHAKHSCRFGWFVKKPGLQSAHATCPALSWNFPAVQSMQSDAPAAGWYFPCGQESEHASFRRSTTLYMPAAHNAHAVARPVPFEYLPWTHSSHALERRAGWA